MIHQIVMPDMGATGEDIVVGQWLVTEGDYVKAGQPILVVETDKATIEVEAFCEGYLRKILAKEGETAAIGDVLAIISDSMDEPLADAAPETPARETSVSKVSADLPSPPSTPPEAGRVQASPLARRLAKERGIDLASIQAAGPIHKRDILPAAPPGVGGDQRIELSPMRRAIAVRTLQSKTQAPHFYVTARIDMTEALALQKKFAGPDRPTVTDLVIRAVAMALRDTPDLNASCQGDQVVRYGSINIGLVVGLTDGMIIPVIRQADTLDLYQLAATTKRLRDQVAAGELSQADLAQGTFTISNLGMFGVESFIAVINPPEAGILALGAIQPQPAILEDRIAARSMMIATLSADHRVVDGVMAARFLNQVRESLENPAVLLPTSKEMLP